MIQNILVHVDMLPPEQYGFAQTDIRSDIYALGITLQKLQPKNKKLQKIIKKSD